MNKAEMVTDFKLEANGQNIKVADLIKALNKHCRPQLQGESFCCSAAWDNPEETIPARFRWLIAYAVEGESEGWYVHVGVLIQGMLVNQPTIYKDFGFAKVWTADDCYALAKEAQRFLTAARWN
jgi:hypothetical protein